MGAKKSEIEGKPIIETRAGPELRFEDVPQLIRGFAEDKYRATLSQRIYAVVGPRALLVPIVHGGLALNRVRENAERVALDLAELCYASHPGDTIDKHFIVEVTFALRAA